MRLFYIVLLICCNQLLFGQNGGKINGIVHNTDNQILPKATVSIIDQVDSTVISYTLSDDHGKFQFARLPSNKKLILFISHISSNVFSKDFELSKDENKDFGIIKLSTTKDLDEVLITAQPPIRMNSDTLEYNADYFKTKPNANVEELLRELPGLQVNIDGTIYYQGKEVSQVKVNGKDFFASDLRIATRNLDASLIKTVQVYRDKGESKRTVENEENLPVTINLKFKKDFLKADFGKVYGSGGSRDRYETGGLFNMFRDTLQVSLIGYGNNINRQSFDYKELNQQAGLGRAENYGFNDFGGQSYQGVSNTIGAGINVNNDWGQKTKLNIMYMYNYKKENNEYISEATSLYNGIEEASNATNNSTNRPQHHRINGLLRHRFDTTSYVQITPSFSISNTSYDSENFSKSGTAANPLTQRLSEDNKINRSLRYNHRFYLEKQFSKQHLLSFSNNITLDNQKINNKSNLDLIMYQEDIPQSYLWTNTIHNRKNKNVHLSTAYYNKVIKKLNFDVYFTTNLYQELPLNEYYFDKDNAGTIRGLQYENSFKLNTIDYISGIKFYYKPTDKLIINFGTAFQSKHNDFNFLSIDEDRQLKNSYWLPNINIRYKNLEARWSMDVENPNTYAIQTQLNDLDNNYITLPSLNFNPVKKQNAVLSYNKYNNKYQLGGNINMNYEDRSIGYSRIRNPDNGQITFQQKETGSTYRFHSYGYFRYNFKSGKDWQYYVSTNPSIYTYQQYQSINSIDNKLQSIGGNISQEFSIRWKHKIGIAP